jgi:hypothetical protein
MLFAAFMDKLNILLPQNTTVFSGKIIQRAVIWQPEKIHNDFIVPVTSYLSAAPCIIADEE